MSLHLSRSGLNLMMILYYFICFCHPHESNHSSLKCSENESNYLVIYIWQSMASFSFYDIYSWQFLTVWKRNILPDVFLSSQSSIFVHKNIPTTIIIQLWLIFIWTDCIVHDLLVFYTLPLITGNFRKLNCQ